MVQFAPHLSPEEHQFCEDQSTKNMTLFYRDELIALSNGEHIALTNHAIRTLRSLGLITTDPAKRRLGRDTCRVLTDKARELLELPT